MKYHFLVGRDATRALATGCRQPACLVPSLLGLKVRVEEIGVFLPLLISIRSRNKKNWKQCGGSTFLNAMTGMRR